MGTFNNDGSYNKTNWKKGDIITSENLNKIEDALYEINEDGKNHATKSDLNSKANKTHYHSEYMTYQSFDGYATESYVDSAISNIPKTDLSSYATKSDVDSAINNIPKTDLSNYATKDELNNKANKTHSHNEYVTDSELNNKGYLTKHQSLDDYATKLYVLETISSSTPNVNLSTYATINYVDSNYAIKNHAHKEYLTSVPSGYATESYVNDKIKEAQVNGGNNIDLSNYATKSELNNKADKSHAHDNYATQSFVTNKIAEAQLSGGTDGGSVDLSGYATKDDIANKANKSDIPTKTSQLTNDSGFITSIPSEYITDAELLEKDYATKGDIDNAINNAEIKVDLSDYALKTDIPTVPTNLSSFANDAGYVTETVVDNKVNNAVSNINLSDYALKTEIPTVPTDVSAFNNDANYITEADIPSNVSELINDAGYITESNLPSLDGYALKTDIPTIPTNVSVFVNDIGYAYRAEIPTNVSQLNNDAGYVAINGITRIEVVDELPENEELGVLYIVK